MADMLDDLLLSGGVNRNTGHMLIQEPPNIAMGYNCKSPADGACAVGYNAASTANNAISVGVHVSATHQNSVVIGSYLSSKHDNTTLFNHAELSSSGMDFNGGVSIVSHGNSSRIHTGKVCDSSACNTGIEPTVNSKICDACNCSIVHGVTWIRDGYVKKEKEYSDLKLGLCFDCIFDCVMEHKFKLRLQEMKLKNETM